MRKTPSKKLSRRSSRSYGPLRDAKESVDSTKGLKDKILSVIFLSGDTVMTVERIAALLSRLPAGYAVGQRGFERIENFPE